MPLNVMTIGLSITSLHNYSRVSLTLTLAKDLILLLSSPNLAG
jgi:hypothetical protein